MTINQQLEALRAGLADYAQSSGAELAVAADRGDFLRRIENNPTGMSIVLMFTGERCDAADREALVVWRTFAAVLARPHGWTVTRADNLTAERPDAAPFYNVLEDVRNGLLNVVMEVEYPIFATRYTGSTLLDTGAAPMDAWEIGVECGARLTE